MSNSDLDPHGQSHSLGWNQARRVERDLAELLGLVKGVLADGVVSEREALHLGRWLACHEEIIEQWPVNRLAERLVRIFHDGRVDREERRDLRDLLESIVGGRATLLVGRDAQTDLPLDNPQPASFAWPGSVVVFTGTFAFGPQLECERLVTGLGACCEATVTHRTRYLVIGSFGSRDWIQTSFGRDVQAAVAYRAEGHQLSIVGEDHWAAGVWAATMFDQGRKSKPNHRETQAIDVTDADIPF